MRQILILGPASEAAVAAVVEYARERVNWYEPGKPGKPGKVPGDDPRHCCFVGTYWCVFSYTVGFAGSEIGKVYRHLSVSVRGPDRLPDVAPTVAIARMFGFTGEGEPPPSWAIAIGDKPTCVVIGQEIEGLTPT